MKSVIQIIDDEIVSLPLMEQTIMESSVLHDFSEPIRRLEDARERIRELIEADIEYDSARDNYNFMTRTGNYTPPRALHPNDPVLIDYRNAIERRRKALLAIQGLST
jgi:hypothetical protein